LTLDLRGESWRLWHPDDKGRTVMDTDLESLSREQRLAEVRKLRNGIREHRDSTGHDSAGIIRDCGGFFG
jgi:hypothetical protein